MNEMNDKIEAMPKHTTVIGYTGAGPHPNLAEKQTLLDRLYLIMVTE